MGKQTYSAKDNTRIVFGRCWRVLRCIWDLLVWECVCARVFVLAYDRMGMSCYSPSS